MMHYALRYLVSIWKIKNIFEQRSKYKDRKWKLDEMFYWEKSQAEYLYLFTINKFEYNNLLNSDYKRKTFPYQVYGDQMLIQK